MNIDDPDLTPTGGTLSRPVLGPHRRVVATFTPTQTPDPADLWEPFSRTTDQARDGQQGDPLGGYRPGHGIEHEPVDDAERASQHTVQRFDHVQAANQIRSALRGGIAG
jgi:hypothetical protein